jgi:hypothetical protein
MPVAVAITGSGIHSKVDHSCLPLQAVCDRSMVQPKKIRSLLESHQFCHHLTTRNIYIYSNKMVADVIEI